VRWTSSLLAKPLARRDTAQRGKAIIADGRKALASESIARSIATDVEFHGFIYELSGNSLIGDTMELLWYRLRYAMSAYLRHSDWADETWDEHAAILQAILDRDPDRAERLAGAHVDTATVLLQGELTRAEASTGLQTGRLRPLVLAAGSLPPLIAHTGVRDDGRQSTGHSGNALEGWARRPRSGN
jgi:hypothetical protein